MSWYNRVAVIMEPSVMNLYNQFESLRAQVDGLNESIEPRKSFLLFVVVSASPRFSLAHGGVFFVGLGLFAVAENVH